MSAIADLIVIFLHTFSFPVKTILHIVPQVLRISQHVSSITDLILILMPGKSVNSLLVQTYLKRIKEDRCQKCDKQLTAYSEECKGQKLKKQSASASTTQSAVVTCAYTYVTKDGCHQENKCQLHWILDQ